MSVLTQLKASAAAKLVTVDTDVKSYVTELEASVKANKVLLIGVGVACLLVGGVVGHLI